jgi:hypothetical protein
LQPITTHADGMTATDSTSDLLRALDAAAGRSNEAASPLSAAVLALLQVLCNKQQQPHATLSPDMGYCFCRMDCKAIVQCLHLHGD